MKILSEDKKSFIEILPVEYETERMPSVKVIISIQNEGFKGSNETWIEIDKLNSFISNMDIIDSIRAGKAHLCSMSPEDLIIDFETYDKSGHIRVTYSITRFIGDYPSREISLHGAFNIDSSEFSNIVKSFRVLQR